MRRWGGEDRRKIGIAEDDASVGRKVLASWKIMGLPCGLLLLASFATVAWAQSTTIEAVSAENAPGTTISIEEYQAHLERLRGLVAACRIDAGACDPAKVGGVDRVAAIGKNAAFEVHWSWLWDAVMKARNAAAGDREKLLDAAEARLSEETSETGGEVGDRVGTGSAIPFEKARADADRVLARSEFRHVTKNSFWEELLERLFSWISRVFGGVSALGHRNPWLGPVVEGAVVVLALTGLLGWVRRVMVRQRLAIRMESPAAQVKWKKTARSWATLAETAAAEGAWREAVHSLYWASVTELEGQRVWRQNSARTPREYLRLVPPDAPQYAPLRVLTQLLERIWYGLDAAEKRDYEKALAVYNELRSA